MTLQNLLDLENITKYQLSKASGIPKTTVIDICSGKTTIEKCNAKTIQQIARVLNRSMEEIMRLDNSEYHPDTGMPINEAHYECGLPKDLKNSINNMKKSQEIVDSGKNDIHWDLYWCELNADINYAEVENLISSEQAWYLRSKYLRMKKEDNV